MTLWLLVSVLSFSLYISTIIKCDSVNLYVPTTSDSSGDYYTSQRDGDLSNGIIICNSNKSCHIQCNHDYSCSGAKLYVSSMDTSINCGWMGCNNTIIYTDYTNYPNSTVTLSCVDSFACDYVKIQDIFTNLNSYYDGDKFKISCSAVLGCNLYGLSIPYPIITPTIYDETGEYYSNIGSYTSIQCTHSLLCSIDCSNGGCLKSSINCGNSDKCMVICDSDGIKSHCNNLKIIANGNNEFSFDCSTEAYQVCQSMDFDIQNVNTVNIDCSVWANSSPCQYSTFNIQNVDDLSIRCDVYYPCKSTKWNITNITNNASIHCDDCNDMSLNLNNVPYVDIQCQGGGDACTNLEINGNNMAGLNLQCELAQYEGGCNYMNICMDGALNIDCLGQNSCSFATYCDSMSMVNIDCVGINSCKTSAPTLSPTTTMPSESPTVYPTAITSSPTQPTVSPTTGTPTTAYPITASPTTQPSSIVPSSIPIRPPTIRNLVSGSGDRLFCADYNILVFSVFAIWFIFGNF